MLHTWHSLKVNYESGHEKSLEGEEAHDEGEEEPLAVVAADNDDAVEGPEDDPGDDGRVGKDCRHHARLADHHVNPRWEAVRFDNKTLKKIYLFNTYQNNWISDLVQFFCPLV